MKRLNITLPDEIEKGLKIYPNKSYFIALAIREKLEREREYQLDKLLIEGYQTTKKEDKKVNQDWEKAALNDW